MVSKHRKITTFGALAASFALLAGCTSGGMDHSSMGHGSPTTAPGTQHAEHKDGMQAAGSPEVLTGTSFTLTAQESRLMITDTNMRTAMTFNGTVPGPQIRVNLGDEVKITLKNELDEPTTIHWHGMPVPNEMDGIPGVTMNAVQPGDSFTYRFKTSVPGTYWYHSHQNGVVQVDKGLYGSFVVVDPNEKQPDRDYTLVLDEWMEDGEMDHRSMNMHGMNHGAMNHGSMDMDAMNGMSDAEMMPLMYTIFTANGKSGSSIEPLMVKEGETVRIRLINAGFLSHPLYLQGHEFKIVSTDGQPIHNPPLVNGLLLNIAPGERYDIEFVANNPGAWVLAEQSQNPGASTLTIPIVYEGAEGGGKRDNEKRPVIDISRYGEAAKSKFSLNDPFDLEYTMDLNTRNSESGITYTINGKSFPDTDPIKVQEGDLIKVTLVNNSPEDVHPMHLHGHFFQVLSKNGQPVSGSPLLKDTLNVLPGEQYVIAFEADNAGNWMFHCHDLGHASAGMVTQVNYKGYTPAFTVDPKAGNQPE